MSRPILFRRIAQVEFDSAADWYDKEQSGLGTEFIHEVRRVLGLIASQPDRYPIVEDGIREAILQRFPYAVYFQVNPLQIDILSVFHTSRDPSTWRSRQ